MALSEELDKVIEQVNMYCADDSSVLGQLTTILNAHTAQLQAIDMTTAKLQEKVNKQKQQQHIQGIF